MIGAGRAIMGVKRLLRSALPGGRGRRKAHGAGGCALPILLYHRIAVNGPPELDPYRVTPDQFASQIQYLEKQGYHSITLDEWRTARSNPEPLPGHPLIITFDDGYRDFATRAWPTVRI